MTLKNLDRDSISKILFALPTSWYLVEEENGTFHELHESCLSSILQCGLSMQRFGIVAMEQGWGGQDYAYDDWTFGGEE